MPLNELSHAPGEVVRWLLIDLGVAAIPGTDDDWPAYHNGEPDRPDDVVTIYDTAGVDQGRDQISGFPYSLRGLQIRVRSVDQQEGWLKADEIRTNIAKVGTRDSNGDRIVNSRIVVDGVPYLITSFARIGQVLLLGKEKTANKRSLYTVNCLVSLRELEE